jgi:putative ABC transport system permease protein
MVTLGLTGVVWQNVTQRIREIGLRRAKGARIENIHRQILGELVVMSSLALLVGVLLVAQVPLLPLPADLTWIPVSVFVLSILLSVVAIYVLTLLCGWYPARLATKIQPAEALHYE